MAVKVLKLIAATCALHMLVVGSVYAQDQTALVAATKAQLQARGVQLSGACGAAQITVRVAFALRDQGYGLLVKRAGNRAVFLPDGSCVDGEQTSAPGFATDYLIQPGTFFGYDVLGDGGGANNPQWMGPEMDAEMVQRNRNNFAFAPNLDNVTPAPQPIPPPAPQPLPAPSPQPIPQTPSIDYTRLLERIIDLQIENLAVAKDTNAKVANIDRTFGQTMGAIGKFAGRYIAPALGAFIAARQFDKEK